MVSRESGKLRPFWFFNTPPFESWNAFRRTAKSVYAGLTVPRFLLRQAYGKAGKRLKTFNYEERFAQDEENGLWGNGAFGYAVRIVQAFARRGWGAVVSNGTVDMLPLYQPDPEAGEGDPGRSTEVVVGARHARELEESGFIPLSHHRGRDDVFFPSAHSCHKE